MIQKFNRKLQNDRRILSFPAVHPCEAICPATLLASLTSLAHNICNYQSKSFATQRRNVRETIRQIAILLVFFDAIHDRGLTLSDSVLLCFSELHLTFQKIQFLLEDCSREGSRLWILVKSQHVVTQFRVLIRGIATALDILPLNSIDVCSEVKELVELVAKQARKAKLEVDSDDEHAMNRVLTTLDLLDKGVEPEFQILKWVLDYLDIKSWNDCNKEIKFLEDEIEVQCSTCDEREVPFLSSLLGFMSYCRGVVFQVLDDENRDQIDVRCIMETLSCLNPDDFRCPISLELMTDPVTVATGQTYDRSSIQKWLKAGNTTCPKTGEKLKNTEFVPNTALKKLIQQFCADHGISLGKSGRHSRDITRTIIPGSPAAAAAMRFLSRFLARRLFFGEGEEKNKAAYEIRLLTKSNIFNRACLIEAGTIPPLLKLLASYDRSAQENAIGALLKLSKHTSGKKVMVESGGLNPILAVLNKGLSMEAKQMAAATIFYLSSVKGYRKLIGDTPESIPSLLELIKDGTNCGKKNAVVAIFGLLLYPENKKKALASGAVQILLNILTTSDKVELIADSLAVLATLAEDAEGTFAILEARALRLIIGSLQCLTCRAGKEYCVSILLSLCNNGGDEVIGVLAKDPSLMAALYSLLTDGTSHGSKKACTLMKILHEFQETRTVRAW
ncbi:U-box domain-containing protein 19-like [Carica papaya]|uniref:U-box domain-containing protein 19-like n=1 Tax=Carica papaya TaxID=3649 RepID=UPI000B8CD964|nr:U-box domain-containing protein 19-like [Carica papaya]